MYNYEYLSVYKNEINYIREQSLIYIENKGIQYNLDLDDSFFNKVLNGNDRNHKEIIIKNKSKKRTLYEPTQNLKIIQKYILEEILYKYEYIYSLDTCIKGFLKNSTVLDNAKPHLNKKVLIKMDIKDFFDSITRKRIYDIFRKQNKFSYETSYLLSKLVTCNNRLPQGAITSPFLSNICAKGIDSKINLLLKKISISKQIDINYTRYADDITISLNKSMNYDYIINALIEIIESEGFTPNYRKTKVIKKSQCQRVTGIVVNSQEPKIQRKELKKIDFILYIWETYSIETAIEIWNKHKFGKNNLVAENATDKLIEILQGKISFFRMVNEQQSEYLYKKFNLLNEKYNVKNKLVIHSVNDIQDIF